MDRESNNLNGMVCKSKVQHLFRSAPPSGQLLMAALTPLAWVEALTNEQILVNKLLGLSRVKWVTPAGWTSLLMQGANRGSSCTREQASRQIDNQVDCLKYASHEQSQNYA